MHGGGWGCIIMVEECIMEQQGIMEHPHQMPSEYGASMIAFEVNVPRYPTQAVPYLIHSPTAWATPPLHAEALHSDHKFSS